nr:reverse transcriptase domain, reverse transcriptase zinc-binding domain protein [Tanacetum cinerariifolium]
MGNSQLFSLLKLEKPLDRVVFRWIGIGLCGSRIVFLVWYYARDLAGMDLVPPVMHDILLYLQPMAYKRTVRSVFGRLILAATAYHIWLERNNRVFKKVRRTPEEIRDIIMVTVRLKLLTFQFKNTAMLFMILLMGLDGSHILSMLCRLWHVTIVVVEVQAFA